MVEALLSVRGLVKTFGGIVATDELHLDVVPGEIHAVIGPNGAGKTTLVKLILGILDSDRGNVRIFGRPPREVVSRIGYVPQDIHVNKGFPISVQDVVCMGRVKGGGGWKRFSMEDRTQVRRALERVEMETYSTRRMDELSGGQRQRVFLARAMVSKPEILFLDEPLSSIDTKGQTEFYDFLQVLNKTATIVVITHDAMVLTSHAKSVACVNQQLFFHDAPELTREMLETAYCCPVELIAHGVPHRVLLDHSED